MIANDGAGIAIDSPLLKNLARAYPNGQMPVAQQVQAAKELSQNPAVLKLTAGASQENPLAKATDLALQTQALQTQAVSADYQPVTRIQNTTLTGAYFFSIYPSEVSTALAGNPNWNLEGPAFWASLAPDAALNPVHRFRNVLNGSYLYTIYDTEKQDIITNYSSTFVYEGVAWYAKQTTGTGWSPLYRFRNLLNGTYLFSAFESEKDAIVTTYSAVFALEGIAYYVRQDAPCTAAPIGTTGYSQVFKGCNAANVATYYAKDECVRDNATGLIWQGQTAAGTGLRANDQYKTNYDSTTELQQWNGDYSPATFRAPTAAEANATTNSIGFKNAVNATNLCGSGAWRLPTKDELLGIVKTSEYPTIDNSWFPNTVDRGYWTSSPYAGYAWGAWLVDFTLGGADVRLRRVDRYGYTYYLVRLVRQDAPVSPPAPACTPAPIASTGYSLVFKACDANNVATYYAKDECVRDNATGLIWQGQTASNTGLRANDAFKTNFDSTTELQKRIYSANGALAPTQAEVDASTNSIGFKNAVNATNLCGSGAWRLPTKDELLGIVKINTTAPMIDTDWFPNTQPNGWYWSSSPDAGNATRALNVGFAGGVAGVDGRSYDYGGNNLVRLVR